MTAKTAAIDKMYPDHFIVICPEDAKDWGISEDDIVKVTSPRGYIKTRAVIKNSVKKGTVSMPFHWDEGANVLTNADVLDPICRIPGLKLSGVKIEKAD